MASGPQAERSAVALQLAPPRSDWASVSALKPRLWPRPGGATRRSDPATTIPSLKSRAGPAMPRRRRGVPGRSVPRGPAPPDGPGATGRTLGETARRAACWCVGISIAGTGWKPGGRRDAIGGRPPRAPGARSGRRPLDPGGLAGRTRGTLPGDRCCVAIAIDRDPRRSSAGLRSQVGVVDGSIWPRPTGRPTGSVHCGGVPAAGGCYRTANSASVRMSGTTRSGAASAGGVAPKLSCPRRRSTQTVVRPSALAVTWSWKRLCAT